MDINRKELCRYLGLGNNPPDRQTDRLIDEILSELGQRVTPRFTEAEIALEKSGDKIILGGENGMVITSCNLSANLDGCEKVLIFCATLGSAPDMLIKRYSLVSMAKAAVVQAAGSAMIEAYCNQINRDFEQRYKGEFFLKPRFSPGYGDFALKHQRDFFRLLGIEKKLGVELSDSLLMTPSKSVTAVIGLTKERRGCNISHCACCDKPDCQFRLE